MAAHWWMGGEQDHRAGFYQLDCAADDRRCCGGSPTVDEARMKDGSHDGRRVMITGLGPITAVGIGVEGLWQGLRNHESGIRSVTCFDATPFNCRIAAQVDDFSAASSIARRAAATENWVKRSSRRAEARCTHLRRALRIRYDHRRVSYDGAPAGWRTSSPCDDSGAESSRTFASAD